MLSSYFKFTITRLYARYNEQNIIIRWYDYLISIRIHETGEMYLRSKNKKTT